MIKRKVTRNLGELQDLLIKLTVLKPAQKKTWLFYEFPFSLNPGDKSNVAQT